MELDLEAHDPLLELEDNDVQQLAVEDQLPAFLTIVYAKWRGAPTDTKKISTVSADTASPQEEQCQPVVLSRVMPWAPGEKDRHQEDADDRQVQGGDEQGQDHTGQVDGEQCVAPSLFPLFVDSEQGGAVVGVADQEDE